MYVDGGSGGNIQQIAIVLQQENKWYKTTKMIIMDKCNYFMQEALNCPTVVLHYQFLLLL